jgi:hypothetical protein
VPHRHINNVYALIALFAISTEMASASIIDTDFYCRTYGCVMISDGSGTDVYDVYKFAGGGTVAFGNPLIPWTGNPIQGIGPVNIVETGTTNPIQTSLPAAGNATQLAIDINGDGVANLSINDNNSNGYLDASDSIAAFSLTDSTDVVYRNNALPHSFYLTSRNTRFDIRARATVDSSSSAYGGAVALSDISFSVSITQSGNDAGLSYGSLARNGNFSAVTTINDLGDIASNFTTIAFFTHPVGIRRRTDNANNHVSRQSIRFNLSYGYPALDLSQGEGSIQFGVDYAPYKR